MANLLGKRYTCADCEATVLVTKAGEGDSAATGSRWRSPRPSRSRRPTDSDRGPADRPGRDRRGVHARLTVDPRVLRRGPAALEAAIADVAGDPVLLRFDGPWPEAPCPTTSAAFLAAVPALTAAIGTVATGRPGPRSTSSSTPARRRMRPSPGSSARARRRVRSGAARPDAARRRLARPRRGVDDLLDAAVRSRVRGLARDAPRRRPTPGRPRRRSGPRVRVGQRRARSPRSS